MISRCSNGGCGLKLHLVLPFLASLAVTACSVPASRNADSLSFRPPSAAYTSTVRSDLSPSEIAQEFRSAGYSDVKIINGGVTVRVKTQSGAMVDCGNLIQRAMGNRAEFPGNAPLAAILARPDGMNDILLRSVSVSSRADITRLGQNIYGVSEQHHVTLEYRRTSDQSVWRREAEFDGNSTARFDDNSSCRSSGAVGNVL